VTDLASTRRRSLDFRRPYAYRKLLPLVQQAATPASGVTIHVGEYRIAEIRLVPGREGEPVEGKNRSELRCVSMGTGSAGVDLRRLGGDLAGDAVLPGDDGWDAARQAWNLAVQQRPVAVVLPESTDDIVATVVFAAENGLRIAFNAGGHNAGPIDWSNDVLLLKFERMRGVEIDANARRARVEAGVLGKPLAEAAGEHGLCYLSGTSPDVGVLGYTLGGGFSWMIRKYGLASNSVLGVELVTADGRHRRADKDHEPDLFWAVRGGGATSGR
jgi:hypothetical protein